jgi:predicted transcriptional regulator
MTSGGKRLNELIKKYGFRLGAVAEAIGVQTRTMGKWDRNAPIGKLMDLSDFTHIPLEEVIECFRPHPESIDTATDKIDRPGAIESKVDRTGGEEN